MTWGSNHRMGFGAAQNAWENPPDGGSDEEYEPEQFTATVVMLDPTTDRELASIEVEGTAWRDSDDSIAFELTEASAFQMMEWGWKEMDEQCIEDQIIDQIEIPDWDEYLRNKYDWR